MTIDRPALSASARRYLKHQARAVVLPVLVPEGISEETAALMASHGADVSRHWFGSIQPLNLTDPHTKNQLSSIVNAAFVEAIGEVRDTLGDDPEVLRALARFHRTFNIDDMLPEVFS